MTRIAFTVPGRPKGKGRPRFVGKGRPPITPKATVAAEKEIATEYRLAARSTPLMTGTVRLTIEAVFRVPVSWPKDLRTAAFAGEVEYTGKPDRDNIDKLYMDALNEVAWVDDAQVHGPPVVRRYGQPERVDVIVEELQATPGLKSPAERRREEKVASGSIGKPKRRRVAPRTSELLANSGIGRRIR